MDEYEVDEYGARVRVAAVKPVVSEGSQTKERTLTTLQDYDKPMGCSTGV